MNSPYSDDSEVDEDIKLLNLQETTSLDGEIDFQDNVLQDRDKELSGIHAQIIQINDLFKDIQKMVLESSETVDNISIGIRNTETNVTAGHSEIVEAGKQQTGQRNRTCIIALIVLFVAAALVGGVILAIKLKPEKS